MQYFIVVCKLIVWIACNPACLAPSCLRCLPSLGQNVRQGECCFLCKKGQREQGLDLALCCIGVLLEEAWDFQFLIALGLIQVVLVVLLGNRQVCCLGSELSLVKETK